MFIILFGSIFVYIYYLKEKSEELDSIRRGFCPKCSQKSIELTDQRSSGCSGPKILSFECVDCGYSNSFAIDSSGCSGNSCS
ncbi:MAG: hypothetical protein QM493_04180 [Sulfurovum sp.]